MQRLSKILGIGLKTLGYLALANVAFVTFLFIGAISPYSIEGERSVSFPKPLQLALERHQDVQFDDHLPEGSIVCIVPEYTNASSFLQEYGISAGPRIAVPELEVLVFLMRPDETTEYLGLGVENHYLEGGIGRACYETSGMIWKIEGAPNSRDRKAERVGGLTFEPTNDVNEPESNNS